MEQAVLEPAPRRRSLAAAGLALTIAGSVVFAVLIEALAAIMARNSASWSELGVLALFATPLVTAWVAIAISLATRPLWLRLSVAALLLLAPPAILFGAFHG